MLQIIPYRLERNIPEYYLGLIYTITREGESSSPKIDEACCPCRPNDIVNPPEIIHRPIHVGRQRLDRKNHLLI